MFSITESINDEIGSCDYCGAVGGVFGEFTDSNNIVSDVEMCPDCYIIVMGDE